MLKAISDENMVLSLHIGAGFQVIQKAPEAPVDQERIQAAVRDPKC